MEIWFILIFVLTILGALIANAISKKNADKDQKEGSEPGPAKTFAIIFVAVLGAIGLLTTVICIVNA